MPAPTPDRYHRQALLADVGDAGQAQLGRSRALLVGCGALGSVAADWLVRAGVGHVVIADRDFVELTNLQRQVLFDESDVRDALPKAEAARRKLQAVNSQVEVTAIIDDVNADNIERYAQHCDVIVDGTDNFQTRYLINDVSVKRGVPYVYGGAVGTSGLQYTVLPRTAAHDSPWEQANRTTPCLRCVFDEAPAPGAVDTCDTAGVLSPAVGIIASYEATAAMKVLLGQWNAIEPTLLAIDPWQNDLRAMSVANAMSDDCVCCGKRTFEHLAGDAAQRTVTMCGRDAVQLRANNGTNLDLSAIADRLRAHGHVNVNDYMLRAALNDAGGEYELTLFPDGRAIVKGTQTPATARSLYARYVGA